MLIPSSTNSAIKRTNMGNFFFRASDSICFEFGNASEYIADLSLLLSLVFVAIFQKSFPYTCLGNSIWTLFISGIINSDYIGFFWNFLHIGLKGIQISHFLNFRLLFTKKGLKNPKKLNKIEKTKSITIKVATISIVIITLILFKILKNFDKIYEPKQRIDVKNIIANLLFNPKNPSIVPLLSFRLNDKDFIWGVGLGCENENIDQVRSYEDQNINISNCFFSRLSEFSGDGGVIYVNSVDYSMNLNYSMFYNCFALIGGAIYFSSSNSYLRMICAHRCSCGASSYSHFALLKASQVNQVEYLSISFCSHTLSGYYPIRIESGNQRIDNVNSSMNNALMTSGINIWSPSSFTSSYCTLSNNKVSNSFCINIYSTTGTVTMSYANIVHNNSPTYGVVYTVGVGTRNMIYCIFHDNQDYLFCVWQGSLEVSHSFIDHSASFSRSLAVSTSNNNSLNYRNTYQIQFFNSHHCNTDIPTPSRTFERSPMRSFEETISRTIEETLRMTNEETISRTNEETLRITRTFDQTAKETPNETINRSNDENKSNTVFIYVIVGLLILIVVLISYIIGNQMKQNKKDSSSSSLANDM